MNWKIRKSVQYIKSHHNLPTKYLIIFILHRRRHCILVVEVSECMKKCSEFVVIINLKLSKKINARRITLHRSNKWLKNHDLACYTIYPPAGSYFLSSLFLFLHFSTATFSNFIQQKNNYLTNNKIKNNNYAWRAVFYLLSFKIKFQLFIFKI